MIDKVAQGTFDGFCGLYACALGAAEISTKADSGSANLIFYEMLRALEKRKRLTAKRIASLVSEEIGFKCSYLAAAFNDIRPSRRLKLGAVPFSSTRFRKSKFRGNAKHAFEQSCAFIIKVDGGSHWVAAISQNSDGSYECIDPSPEGKHKSFSKIFWDEGLMVGPVNLIEDL